MPSDWYILNEDKTITRCADINDYIDWQRTKDGLDSYKSVGRDTLEINKATYTVSTVFLGLDHSWCDNGRPLVFETMVFAGDLGKDTDWEERICLRYSSYDNALKGHNSVVRILTDAKKYIEEGKFSIEAVFEAIQERAGSISRESNLTEEEALSLLERARE